MRKVNNIRLSNRFVYNKREILGSGTTGDVYLGESINDSTPVAVKVIELKTIKTQVTRYLLSMEKIAVMSCDNPHVLRGIQILQSNGCCYIVTELCNGGSLRSAIRSSGPLGEEKSVKILTQILRGTCSFLEKGILHRDLKPANILFHDGLAKIIDFGYSQIEGHQKPTLQYNVGSPSYMSPEAFLENRYSQKSEIWAIGMIFYECLNGKTFGQGKEMTEVYSQIKSKGLSYQVQVSNKCKNILNWCFQQDPANRPTALELLNFIQSQQTNNPTQRLCGQSNSLNQISHTESVVQY